MLTKLAFAAIIELDGFLYTDDCNINFADDVKFFYKGNRCVRSLERVLRIVY